MAHLSVFCLSRYEICCMYSLVVSGRILLCTFCEVKHCLMVMNGDTSCHHICCIVNSYLLCQKASSFIIFIHRSCVGSSTPWNLPSLPSRCVCVCWVLIFLLLSFFDISSSSSHTGTTDDGRSFIFSYISIFFSSNSCAD